MVREDRSRPELVAYIVTGQGVASDSAALHSTLRQALRQSLPEAMVPTLLVVLAELPLNASGKVDREALPVPERVVVENGSRPPEGTLEEALAEIWREVLGVPQVGAEDDFYDLGGDSILGIRVVSRANEAGLRLTVRQLFEARTVAALASELAAGGSAGGPTILAEQEPVVGPALLTPIQHRFFEPGSPDPHWVNQAVLLESSESLDEAVLAQALADLVEHHDALRLRFAEREDGWHQEFAAPGAAVSLTRVDLGVVAPQERAAALETTAAQIQGGFDLSQGPLLRAACFQGDGPDRLLLVAHHLAVDGVSWRILGGDLEAVYRRRRAGKALALPGRTTSYRQWAERLADHAHSSAMEAAAGYWLAGLPTVGADALPVDHPGPPDANRYATVQVLESTLEVAETGVLLRQVPEVFGTGIEDALLTALVETFAGWTGHRRLLVDLESHGRNHPFDDIDIGRTVGWFTTVYPVRLDLQHSTTPDEALKVIKEQRRRIPSDGLVYGLLRYLGTSEALRQRLRQQGGAQVSFNYLGQLDTEAVAGGLFRLAPPPQAPSRSPRGVRRHLLEVDGGVREGRLHLRWSYSEAVHNRATIATLMASYLDALRRIVAIASGAEEAHYTPSDFDDVELNDDLLANILSQVGG